MKTAEESLFEDMPNGLKVHPTKLQSKVIQFKMIEFAKKHVQKALEQASENAIGYEEPDYLGGSWYMVDKDSILNAYPLENIK